MKPSSCLDDHTLPLIIDASAAINLAASGVSSKILGSFPNRSRISTNVLNEIKAGHVNGYKDHEVVNELIKTGALKILELGSQGKVIYAELVSGAAISTLDDGEAATIGLAAELQGIAVIDEKKATRICNEMIPRVPVRSTIDLLRHQNVASALGRKQLANAVYDALQIARMRVPSEHCDWVIKLIGADRVAQCQSLPAFVKNNAR